MCCMGESMKMTIVCAALACAVLAGCATSAVPVADAVPVPADRVLAFRSPSDGKATLVVIRDRGFAGSACFSSFAVNGVLAARIGPSERVELIVPAGELLLRVGRDPQGSGLCAMNEQWVQRETILRPGERKTFRLSLSANGQMDVMRTND